MKLITEQVHDVKFLVEENKETGKKNYVIEGVFMVAEEPNRNGRYYPKHILQRECLRYNRDYIQQNRAWGELNHPNGPTINLDRVSHMITSLVEDGNYFIGKAKILQETPMGKIAHSLLEAGGQLAVSTRGVGNLKEGRDGKWEVQEDFFLATPADIVADPSAPKAFVRGIMEGADWIYIDGQGWIAEFADRTKKRIDNSARGEDRERVMVEAFQAYLKKLSESIRV